MASPARHVDVISEESRLDLDTGWWAQLRVREFLRPREVPFKREAVKALTLQTELHLV